MLSLQVNKPSYVLKKQSIFVFGKQITSWKQKNRERFLLSDINL